MKRILMIGITPPEEGGSERHIYELSSRIDSCTVLTQKGSICKKKIELPVWKRSLFFRNITFALLCYIYSIKLMFARKQYDLIHVHENLLYFLLPLLRLRYETAVTVHGIKGFKFYDSKRRWFFFRWAIGKAHKVIAVNTEDKILLGKYFGNVTYIPNGVDLSPYSKINPKAEKKIVFIGRIHEQKGIIYLLKAFEIFSKKFKDFNLELIGEVNDYAISLQKKFPSKNIIWRGYLSSRDEIVSSLKSSYCIALPSLWEGLPLTLFEALASARPVVVSDIPAFKSVIKDEALFFKSQDEKDLTDKLSSLVNNKKLASLLARRGSSLSKLYTWESICEKLTELYEK